MFALLAFAGVAFAADAPQAAPAKEIPVYTKENITEITGANKSIVALAVNKAHEGIESIKKSFKNVITQMQKKFQKVQKPDSELYDYVIYVDDSHLVPEIVLMTGDEITNRWAVELDEIHRQYEKEMRRSAKKLLKEMKLASKLVQKHFEELLGDAEPKADKEEKDKTEVKESSAERKVRILKEKLARAEADLVKQQESKKAAAEKAEKKAAEKAAKKAAEKAQQEVPKPETTNPEL